jgi:hypothetical protein
MKPGDLAECAIWVDGTESEAMLRQWKADCAFMMASAHEPKLKLGPLSFEIKHPGEDRVPEVPEQIRGPNVRLLIATAQVLGFEIARKATFVDDLSEADLVKLRGITRRQHGHRGPLSDAQCDQVIERLGPVAAGMMVH